MLDKDATKVLNDTLKPWKLGLFDKVDQMLINLMQKMLDSTGHMFKYIPTAFSIHPNSGMSKAYPYIIPHFLLTILDQATVLWHLVTG